jgi:hypothetical protein
MTIWSWLFGGDAMPGPCSANQTSVDVVDVNPATGLPMVGGSVGVDVGGNPYGTDLNAHSFDNHHLNAFDFSSNSIADDWSSS